ncbi:MAG: ATP-binding protein [Chloroflexi bacterium]|nr:ATP-binding protein [Chloroflexota bacterium]MCL5273715.1 ATP-binding protein [Chloroflexota bacterium]
MIDNLLSDLNPLIPLERARTPGRRDRLGIVVGGSLNDGLDIKIDRETIIEGLAVGSYVTIEGQTERRFFGLVTDIMLDSVDANIQRMPPALDDFVTQVYRGTAVYGVLHVKPMLVLEKGNAEPKPIKTVPAHFTAAYRATPEEVQEIFAAEGKGSYEIGQSVDDESIKINLNLEQFVERSSAVFGRSGTGKTFLALPLLASIIKQDVASVLIFDMHNDYGYTLKGDKSRHFKGLKQLSAISSRVAVVTLDEESSRTRHAGYEFALNIGYGQIEPEDLEMLQSVLSLSDVQVNALFALSRKFPREWVHKLMSDDDDAEVKEMLEGNKIADGTYYAIQRKLKRLLKFGFIREQATENFVERIVNYLTRGENVVVEFGRYGNDLPAYVFVANYITRRIHERYVAMKEAAEGGGVEPRQLVIAVEEAHKFLDPAVAGLTIFGTIARELRKYNVTLLIVDQRPSQIDAEVMSQIGTRITCALSDEKDISAVFTGMSGGQQLRSVLASLDSKQQALIMGHAVPMPVVVKTREYGQAVYMEYAGSLKSPAEQHASNQRKLGRSDDEGLI